MFETITLSTAPELRKLANVAFPGYKKRTVFLTTFRGDVNVNSYWDGGSRDVYVLVDLTTMSPKALPTATHPYFDLAGRGIANVQDQHVSVDHAGNLTLKSLPPNWALIHGGTFCGKPATLTIMLQPENLAKLLPSQAK